MSFSQLWYYFVIIAVVCYFIGCINWAKIISKIKHNDITKVGSGNPGTLNMSRTFGLKIGILTLFLDMLKGGLPAFAGYLIFKDVYFEGTAVCVGDFAKYMCGLFVVIGHIYPVTMRFKGGKGIASTLGAFAFSLITNAWYFVFVVLVIAFITIGYIVVTEWGSMGSLIGITLATFAQGIDFYITYSKDLLNIYVILCFMFLYALFLLTWFAHRENLFRLLAGEEHHTSVKKMTKKNKQKV